MPFSEFLESILNSTSKTQALSMYSYIHQLCNKSFLITSLRLILLRTGLAEEPGFVSAPAGRHITAGSTAAGRHITAGSTAEQETVVQFSV